MNFLMHAARLRNVELVRLLLHHDTNINLFDSYNMNALMYAVGSESIEIVQDLCKQGADIERVYYFNPHLPMIVSDYLD